VPVEPGERRFFRDSLEVYDADWTAEL